MHLQQRSAVSSSSAESGRNASQATRQTHLPHLLSLLPPRQLQLSVAQRRRGGGGLRGQFQCYRSSPGAKRQAISIERVRSARELQASSGEQQVKKLNLQIKRQN